jgi:hypothetical protein
VCLCVCVCVCWGGGVRGQEAQAQGRGACAAAGDGRRRGTAVQCRLPAPGSPAARRACAGWRTHTLLPGRCCVVLPLPSAHDTPLLRGQPRATAARRTSAAAGAPRVAAAAACCGARRAVPPARSRTQQPTPQLHAGWAALRMHARP